MIFEWQDSFEVLIEFTQAMFSLMLERLLYFTQIRCFFSQALFA